MDDNKLIGQSCYRSYKTPSPFTKTAFGGENMNLPLTTTDNLTEILSKIMEFTRNRHKILIRNINRLHSPGFTPKDMPVDEFSKLMQLALGEYTKTRRLLFVDGRIVKFGSNGRFSAMPVIDKKAKQLSLIHI